MVRVGGELRTVRVAGEAHHFLVARAAGLDELLAAVLARLAAAAVPRDALLRLSLYVPATALPAAGETVVRALGPRPPAVELFAQPPEPDGLAALAWAVTGADARVEHPAAGVARVAGASGLTVLGHDDAPAAGGWEAALAAFAGRLGELALGFGDVVKTWTCFPARSSAMAARTFHDFNLARAAFYPPLALDRYPANTGVGVYERSGLLSGVAARGEGRLVPLESPLQTSAFDYPSERTAKPALFSRGMALALDGDALVLVSGTGPVVGAETAHPGDAMRQAAQVMHNVERLLERDNLRRSGLAAAEDASLVCVVAFATTHEAALATAAVCERVLSESVPRLIVRAPLCRPDMLVEVEGVAAVRGTADARATGLAAGAAV